jgi:antitoxin ChpS
MKMMSIQRDFLDNLNLSHGPIAEVIPEYDRSVVQPKRNKYTIDELIKQCDLNTPLSDAEREWVDAPAIGLEIQPIGSVPLLNMSK